MKNKSIAAIILLLVITATLLVACNNTPVTGFIARFDKKEHYEFNISLADFNNNLNDNELFAHYGTDDDPYYKDLAISNAENYSLRNADEVRPTRVGGTYTVDFAMNEGRQYGTLTTKQVLYVQYARKGNGIIVDPVAETPDVLDCFDKLDKFVVTGDDDPLKSDADHVTLKSTTDTSVGFYLTDSFKPQESSTKVNGFYVGKTFRGASEYQISTAYDWEGKRPVATVTLTSGGNTQEQSYTLPSAGQVRIIDSNQMLAYVRCFDKSSASFQDSPSAYVFNPYTGKTHVLRFTYAYKFNVILTRGEETKRTQLSAVGTALDGNPLLMQFNLPKWLSDNDLDTTIVGAGSETYPKYTTVRFRSGYLSYELSDYDEEIWKALDQPPAEENQ